VLDGPPANAVEKGREAQATSVRPRVNSQGRTCHSHH
jgi:hypothetical protein